MGAADCRNREVVDSSWIEAAVEGIVVREKYHVGRWIMAGRTGLQTAERMPVAVKVQFVKAE